MSKILDIKNAQFSYDGKKSIFQNVNLSLEKGDVLCILGPNGTGKSTLIKCMNTLLKLKSGEILLKILPFDQLFIYSCHQNNIGGYNVL